MATEKKSYLYEHNLVGEPKKKLSEMKELKPLGATAQEAQRARDEAERKSTFSRQLKEMPGLAARESAATAALGIRGRGRGLYTAGATRGAGITGQAARGQAALEATDIEQKAAKKVAGQKQMIMQEIENLRKAKRYDKAGVNGLMYLAEGDGELVKFINDQAASAPSKSESETEKSRTIGDDIKDVTTYLGF